MSVFRSLRFRLVVVLTGVVACAMGVVFLYVVPSLRQALISDRQGHLVVIARGQENAPGLRTATPSTSARMRRPLGGAYSPGRRASSSSKLWKHKSKPSESAYSPNSFRISVNWR